MDTRTTMRVPPIRTEGSRARRALLGVAVAAAIAAGLAGGWHGVRAAGGAAPQPSYPIYPPYPPAPYPYPCYPPCPGIVIYPSGCATPFAPAPPEFTPIPGGPGGPTPPAPPPPIPLQAALLQAVPQQAPPIASPTPGGAAAALEYKVCPQKEFDIPKVIQDMAVAEPWTIYGYGLKRNPNVPYHPMWNSYRHWLSTQNQNMPYSICNPAIWKAGCP